MSQQILEDVIKFVVYKCRENGNPIAEGLAAFIAQTTLNPKTGKFYLEGPMLQQDLQILKEYALKKASDQRDPQLQTITLQIQYDSSFVESEVKRQDRIKKQSIETGKLIDEVVTLEIKNSKDFEGLAQLYKKIFQFLLFKNKEIIFDQTLLTSSLRNFNVEKEVAAALESIIPRAALGPFVSLNPSEKVTQLVELSNLVIGIRLFNKEIGKGGSSLATVQELIEHQGRQLVQLLKQEAVQTVEKCDDYSTFFNYSYAMETELNEDEIKQYKHELTFLRQYLSYILNLQDDIEVAENTLETNQQRFEKEVTHLKSLLGQQIYQFLFFIAYIKGNRSSAPKEQVYPKFAIIAQSYNQLLEERKMMEARVTLYNILIEAKNQFQLTLSQQYVNKCKQLQETYKEDEANQQFEEVQIYPNQEIERLLPQTTPDFMSTPLDYLGFCIWSLVEKDGLLIAGNPNLGVFKFKEKYCVFRDMKAIKEFLKNPENFLNQVIDKCRKNPELIHLLRLEENFKNLQLTSMMDQQQGSLGYKQKLMVDKEAETPIHFTERNFDANYCWNEWELRRKAIQMANIRKRQTKASQTILSNFKTDSDAQVWLKKDQETNTGINKGVNPLRPKNYITGLRNKENK